MKKIIKSNLSPQPIGPYSQAVEIANTLFVSGQIAIDPMSGELIMDSIPQETTRIMKTIEHIIHEAGYEFSDIVKTTIFLSDMKHFQEVNEIYQAYFSSNFPARETVAVLGLPKNANVEISVIAYKDKER